MKNIAVLSVLVIIINAYSFAEENEKKYCFSYGLQFGFVYGQAQEIVYPVSGETKNDLLSELLWDMKPVFYYGIQAELKRADLIKAHGFYSSLSFKKGIPAESGKMEDRDWQSAENSDLTNFSSHTNKTIDFFQLDAAFGYSVPIKSLFYIKPFISGSWMSFSFTGSDGYCIYARSKGNNTYYPIDDNPIQRTFTGKVIQYKQNWLLLAFGISAGTNILHPFIFDVSFQISPLTYCDAEDYHILNDTIFRDFTILGLYVEPSFKASFIVKPVELSFEFSYRYIGKTEGESYVNYKNSGYAEGTSKAGAGLSMTDSRILASVRF